MSYWIPRVMERFYNETVPQDVIQALGREYTGFSIPDAIRHPGLDRNTTYTDVISDSLLLMPRLQNYADPLQRYMDEVVFTPEDKKP